MMPRDFLTDLDQRFDELRRELMSQLGGPAGMAGGARAPAVDLTEDQNEYVLVAEMPGIRNEDIRLDVDENAIRIRGRREAKEEHKGRGIIRRERSAQSFERYLALPEEVNPDGARANFKNGILEITLPKKEPENRNARRIDID